jgi:antitoxin component HigA of HigAB toxin-antitoxin module
MIKKYNNMKLEIIKTNEEYLSALECFEEVFQARSGTSKSDEADKLALLIRDYEEMNFIIN